MINKENKTKEINRIEYIDLLRILSAFAVVLLHVAAQNWYNVDIHTLKWNMFNIFDSIVRWAVPVFVMISGALFLTKEYSIKNIYCKKIFRIVVAFIIWSLIYTIVFNGNGNMKSILKSTIKGYYHMWYLVMIVRFIYDGSNSKESYRIRKNNKIFFNVIFFNDIFYTTNFKYTFGI